MSDENSSQDNCVQDDSTVSIHFSVSLADGTPVDGTADGEPITFTMGEGFMLPVFESVIKGMYPGEKQQVSIEPRDAFGFPDEENRHWMEKSKFAADINLEPGLIMGFETPAGDEIPGMIIELDNDKVLVDFNHPLAGHEVIFVVEVVDIKQAA